MNEAQRQTLELLQAEGAKITTTRLVKKTYGHAKVYDLSVGDGHTFIGNGLINHNTCNFSNLYGGSPQALADAAGIPLNEAKVIWQGWWDGLPKIKLWRSKQERLAETQGFVKTFFGRKIMLADAQLQVPKFGRNPEEKKLISKKNAAFRQSINYPVQGLAADIMKIAMSNIHTWIKAKKLDNDVRMLLTVHDEIVFEIRDDLLPQVIPEIVKLMCFEIPGFQVPLTCDIEISKDWGSVMEYQKHYENLGLVVSTPDEDKIMKETEVKRHVSSITDTRLSVAEQFKISVPFNPATMPSDALEEFANEVTKLSQTHPGTTQVVLEFSNQKRVLLPRKVDKRGFLSSIQALIQTKQS
jgi:DNA polymerase family A